MVMSVVVSLIVTILFLIVIMAFGPLRRFAGFGNVTPTGPAASIGSASAGA